MSWYQAMSCHVFMKEATAIPTAPKAKASQHGGRHRQYAHGETDESHPEHHAS